MRFLLVHFLDLRLFLHFMRVCFFNFFNFLDFNRIKYDLVSIFAQDFGEDFGLLESLEEYLFAGLFMSLRNFLPNGLISNSVVPEFLILEEYLRK